MNNYTALHKTPFSTRVISIIMVLFWWMVPTLGITQDSTCCVCEKMIWNVKVTLMDGWAPVQSIDYKTYNGEIKLTKKEQTEEEFPERVNLKTYTFDEGSLVIQLDDQKIKRESGLGGTHSLSEIDMTLHISASLAENKMWYKEESKCSATAKNVGLQNENIDFKLINLKPETSHSDGEESHVYNRLEKTHKYKHTGSYDIINKETGSGTWLLKPMITIESEDTECHSARYHMPLRVTFLWGKSNADDENETSIGTPLRPQEDLIFTPYGTGITSGAVIQLEVSNPTPDPILFSIGPAVVPPTGEYQGYTILDEISASIDPGETSTYPVDGWCYDIHSKPVQEGMEVTNIGDWISETEISMPFPPGTSLPENSSFEISAMYEEADKTGGVPTSGMFPTYIGTTIPFEHSIDIREDVDEAAPFLLTSMQRIDAVYDSLYKAGEIETPFSSDPAKEALNGKQQPYWIYTSLLAGEPYTIDDFEAKLIDQFENNSGANYDDAPKKVKEQLKEGTEDFWTTFSFVGEEAKVLYAVKKTKKCKCKNMDLKVYFLRERNGTVTGLSKKVTIEGYRLNQGSAKLMKLKMELKKGDLFSFLVTDNQLNCKCSSKKVDCDPEEDWQYTLEKKLKGGKAGDYKSSEFDADERLLDEEDEAKMDKMEEWLRENLKDDGGKVTTKKLKKLIKEQIYVDVTKTLPKKRTFPWRFEISNTCFGEDCGGDKGRKLCKGVLKIEITRK